MMLLALPPVIELGTVRAMPRRVAAVTAVARVAAIEAIDAEFVMVERRPLALPALDAGGSRRAVAAYADPSPSSRLLAIA